MHLRIYDPRVLAIDLRNRRSGFAVFEGPRNLLDFGTTVLPSVPAESVMNRFSDLLRMSLPSIIVVRKDRWQNISSDSSIKHSIEMLTRESETREIQIRMLEQNAVSAIFRNLGCGTKAEISIALARIFPELVWQLPPERKAWESEHPRQSVFDAIALGLAYWQRETNKVGDSQDRQKIARRLHEPFRRPLG
jgi:hypothetical protein